MHKYKISLIDNNLINILSFKIMGFGPKDFYKPNFYSFFIYPKQQLDLYFLLISLAMDAFTL